MNPTKEQLADPKWWDENAPIDATHYACADHTCRPLWVKDGYYSCADEAFSRWREDHAPTIHGELISRPSDWNGEGLPPVGTVCEIMDDDGAWHRAEVRCHGVDRGRPVAICQAKNLMLWCRPGFHCRPIRTPEQIAADEREKAVQQMAEDVGHLYLGDSAITVIYAIHDAGYRKQEQTK